MYDAFLLSGISFSTESIPTHHLLPTKRDQYRYIKSLQQNLVCDDVVHRKNRKKTVSDIKKSLRLVRSGMVINKNSLNKMYRNTSLGKVLFFCFFV